MIKCHRCGQPAWYQDGGTGEYLCPGHCHLQWELRGGRRDLYDRPSPLSVRPSTAADLPVVLEMWDQFWADDEMDCFGRVYKTVDLLHLLVCDGDQVVGLLGYALEREWDAINIVALNILPGFQGRGGAEGLITRLEGRARQSGIGRLIVATSNDNVLALYMYQRMGFKISGILVGAIEPNSAGDHFVGLGGILVRDEIQLEKGL